MLGQNYDSRMLTTATSLTNITNDVTVTGCFQPFDTIACARNAVMTVLVIVTGLLCVLKVWRLHISHYPSKHLYIVFYCATIECGLCAMDFLWSQYLILGLLISWMKLVQLLTVNHLYWVVATRITCKEFLIKRFLVPLFVVMMSYITIIVVLGSIYQQQRALQCFQPYWVSFTSAELLLVQLFTVAAVFITKRLNEISTLDSVRREQKRELWLLVIFFQVSSVFGFIYDLTLRILRDDHLGCSGIFSHAQEIYTPIHGGFTLVKYVLPIWAMLIVFDPTYTNSMTDSQEIMQQNSDDWGYNPVFSPTSDRHGYRHVNYSGVDFSPAPPGEYEAQQSAGIPAQANRKLGTISEEQAESREDLTVEISDQQPIY